MNSESSFWLSPSAVSHLSLDKAFSFYAIVAILAVLVFVSALLIAANKKGAPSAKAERGTWKIQLALQGLVAIGIALFFYCGIAQYIQRITPPNDATLFTAVADSSHITFSYGVGQQTDTLTAPTGTSIQLNLEAKDKVYNLSIPALRINQTILPGKGSSTWFKANNAGSFPIFLSSQGFAIAPAQLKITEAEEYQTWFAKTFDPSGGKTPEEFGEMLFTSKGCKACHSLDGTALIAPSMKGLFGSQRKIKGGKAILGDETYIKRAITEPNAEVADGFNPVMAPFALSEKELDAMVAYIKTLK